MRRSFTKLSAVFATVAVLGATATTVITATPASASTTTTTVTPSSVEPANPNGPWAVVNTTGSYSFVSGPATPPLGTGSLALSIASGQHEALYNEAYGACATGPACTNPPANWTLLTSIDTLGFSAYRASGTTYPSYNMEVDYLGTGTNYTSFVFIPTAATEATGSWQTWDALNPADGAWFSTANLGVGPFNCNFQAAGCSASWAQIQAAYPQAKVRFGLGPNVGSGGTFVGNVDDFTIGVSGSTTAFDFEPSCTTVCYVNAATGNDSNSGLITNPLKTVQAGVNTVQAGGTVNVAAGTYTEQDVINKPVTITGAGAATTIIQGPSTMANSACIPVTPPGSQPTRAVVTLCGSTGSSVTMSGFTISGGATGEDASASCAPLITGVWVSDNDTLNISNSTVTNIYNAAGSSLWGCQQGVGIRAGSSALGLVGHLNATALTVNNYQKGGIVVDGAGSSTTISGSTITGDAAITPFIAMNGIEIARGAAGSIDSTAVSGNECNDVPVCGADPVNDTQSAGILVFDSPGLSPAPTVSVTNNNVTGNDIGIYSDELSGSATISGNTVNANRDEGIFLDEGAASVTNNQITHNGTVPFGVGVIAVQGAANSQGDVNATLTGNTISSNPTGVEALDACPGAGCPSAPATDSFTVHLTVQDNAITGNSTLGADNATPGAPYNSTFNAACNWWGSASGPGPVGPGSGDHISTGVVFSGSWLVSSNLNLPCPGAPSSPTVTQVFAGPSPDPAPTSVEVGFSPGSNGGSPITSYTATCISLTGGPTGSATGTSSPILVGGLAAVGAYQCTVTATNIFGTTPPSAPFFVFVGGSGDCGILPTAPSVLSTGPGNGSATVSWAPAAGQCLAGYVVTPYLSGVAQRSKLIPGPGTTTVMTGLTNGLAYTFTVAAEDGSAVGPASAMTAPITAGAPAVVTSLHVARVAKGALKLTFAVPANNGSPITGYTAACTSTNGGKPKGKPATRGPFTVSGLNAGKAYSCTVKATNKRGTGPASHKSASVKA